MPPFTVRGADGLDLEKWWEENRFQAYQGVSVPGFPNFFTILGPYGYNGSSYFNLIETQMAHIVRCLRRARGGRPRGSRSRPRPTTATSRACSAAASTRCSGRRAAPRPTATTSTTTATCRSAPRRRWRRCGRSRRFDLDDYRFERVSEEQITA